ncbi:MAG TPA: transketolase C-terminal domain-containing protein [Streptosporangiaceae bacterium]|jgi:pyruvate dehydrogenase E1 component beta subunit|nr:transketolase C-terminal domain-containing protein [Streptosporangiaceae bacterium]
MKSLKYWQSINLALLEEMRRDERVIVFGEDVGLPGGPFGATRGLQKEFGAGRVRDTPISEAAIVGMALGSSMSGLRPVVEIMFMDFITLAMDQLVNQAAKAAYMSDGSYAAPMVVRTLAGTHLKSGPQHSQALEAWVAAVPGLKVVWPSTPADARSLLKAAIRDPGPVVVIESASLYTSRGEVDVDADEVAVIGAAAVRRSGDAVTLVSWGAATVRTLAAAAMLADDGIEAAVIDARSLGPIDHAAIRASVRRTGHLVVVQDATGPCSVGSEIIATAASSYFDDLTAAPLLLCPPFAPVPSTPGLQDSYFPSPGAIAAQVRKQVSRRAEKE